MLRLALLNVFRHRGRTTIAVSAIGFGVVALLLAGGFMEWIFWAMRESTIQSQLGHIQITRPGYLQSGAANPFDYLLTDQLSESEVLAVAPEVQVITPRLNFNGLISHGGITIPFVGEGVHSEKEAELSKIFLITQGKRLSSKDENGVILGRGLANSLGVRVGDKIALLAITASGGINGVEGRVRGLFATGTKAFDDIVLRMPIDMARQLLRVTGEHVLVMLLDKTEHTDRVLLRLRHLFSDRKAQVQFVPWYDQADFYTKTVALFSRQMDVVQMIIALIIILSISNTMIMSVLERTGEIGTQMAIGIKRRKILQQFVGEGLLLGIIGGGFGLVIGLVLANVISVVGIPMPSPPGMEIDISGEILLTWPLAAGAFALAVATTLLASLYPAWKASRLEIVNALRHNR